MTFVCVDQKSVALCHEHDRNSLRTARKGLIYRRLTLGKRQEMVFFPALLSRKKCSYISIYQYIYIYIYSSSFPCDTALPEFYGLPKIHRANAPLSPVMAAFDGLLARISVIMEPILNQLLRHVPAHLTNTQDDVDRLNSVFPHGNVPENALIATMDVMHLLVSRYSPRPGTSHLRYQQMTITCCLMRAFG